MQAVELKKNIADKKFINVTMLFFCFKQHQEGKTPAFFQARYALIYIHININLSASLFTWGGFDSLIMYEWKNSAVWSKNIITVAAVMLRGKAEGKFTGVKSINTEIMFVAN